MKYALDYRPEPLDIRDLSIPVPSFDLPKVDGALKATITTNLPSQSTTYGGLQVSVRTGAAAAKSLYAAASLIAEQDW